MRMELRKEGAEVESLWFDCPGCGDTHRIIVKGDSSKMPVWKWNQCIDKPTIKPSLRVRKNKDSNGNYKENCHSFITDGKIKFLEDCTHDSKGQTVELTELES